MNTELSFASKKEQTSNAPVNYKDMEYICRILNSVPSKGFDKPVGYFGPIFVKNSISSSLSSSSFGEEEEGDESAFGPRERFGYDVDYMLDPLDEDNDSLCDEVINEIFSSDINDEFPLFGMIFYIVVIKHTYLYFLWNIPERYHLLMSDALFFKNSKERKFKNIYIFLTIKSSF